MASDVVEPEPEVLDRLVNPPTPARLAVELGKSVREMREGRPRCGAAPSRT